MSKYWKRHYECSCGSHVVMISERYEEFSNEDHTVDIAFFNSYGEEFPLSWRERLRYAWNILRTGTPYNDMVMFHVDEAKRFGEDLIKFAEVKDETRNQTKES